MIKFRYLITFLVLLFATTALRAQDNKVMLGLRGGHNVAFGGFGAVSLETDLHLKQHLMINGGVQYNSIGKTATELHIGYYKDFSWGRISAETLMAYSHLTSVNNVDLGVGIGISSKWIGGKIGYYYRLFGKEQNFIKEPFNIYYELSGNLLPMIEKWDLKLIITNCEIFELERHYQPSFIAQCDYYMRHGLGVSLGLGCKPAGIFNLSPDYYESYLKFGLCYRW